MATKRKARSRSRCAPSNSPTGLWENGEFALACAINAFTEFSFHDHALTYQEAAAADALRTFMGWDKRDEASPTHTELQRARRFLAAFSVKAADE